MTDNAPACVGVFVACGSPSRVNVFSTAVTAWPEVGRGFSGASDVKLSCAGAELTPGSMVLYELTRNFHPVISPMCVVEGSRCVFIMVAHVFSWPQIRLRHGRDGLGRRWSLINSPSGRLAAYACST